MGVMVGGIAVMVTVCYRAGICGGTLYCDAIINRAVQVVSATSQKAGGNHNTKESCHCQLSDPAGFALHGEAPINRDPESVTILVLFVKTLILTKSRNSRTIQKQNGSSD